MKGTSTMRTLLRNAIVFGAALLGPALAARPAEAFSTGGHFTATERGLKRAGFRPTAIRAAQAANYYVDHMVNTKDIQFNDSSDDQKAKNISLFFHFDSLWNAARVDRELAWMERASRTMVLQAKSRRDPQAVLNVLGITLHAIQDFYSHSVFADIDWMSWRGTRIVTMDDLPRDLWENPLLQGRWAIASDEKGLLSGHAGTFYGGPPPGFPQFPGHGDAYEECTGGQSQKQCGLNHDGARRRNGLVAIMMAAEATYDVAKRFETWIADPAFWSSVVGFADNAGVNAAWYRAQRMSAAAGQWGYETPVSKVFQATQLLSAWSATRCSTLAPNCPMNQWERTWYPQIIGMFAAAPPGVATGGGAPRQPPEGTPIFEIAVPPPNLAPYSGVFDVVWGAKRATLELSSASGRVAGTLVLDGKVWAVDATPRASGVDVRAVLGAAMLTGKVFVTGPGSDLTGFLRDAVGGVPDGFLAVRSKRLPGVVAPRGASTAVSK